MRRSVTSAAAAASVVGSSCAGVHCGTISGRSLALGARTPWFARLASAHYTPRSYADTNRMRCSLGRGKGVRRATFGRLRREPLHELQRAHHPLRGCIAPRGIELELQLASSVELHPLVRRRRLRDGAAQLL
jgi:hypothetical protein